MKVKVNVNVGVAVAALQVYVGLQACSSCRFTLELESSRPLQFAGDLQAARRGERFWTEASRFACRAGAACRVVRMPSLFHAESFNESVCEPVRADLRSTIVELVNDTSFFTARAEFESARDEPI